MCIVFEFQLLKNWLTIILSIKTSPISFSSSCQTQAALGSCHRLRSKWGWFPPSSPSWVSDPGYHTLSMTRDIRHWASDSVVISLWVWPRVWHFVQGLGWGYQTLCLPYASGLGASNDSIAPHSSHVGSNLIPHLQSPCIHHASPAHLRGEVTSKSSLYFCDAMCSPCSGNGFIL